MKKLTDATITVVVAAIIVLVVTTYSAAGPILDEARIAAAERHLLDCGLRPYKDFSGLDVWLGSITAADVKSEEQKVNAIAAWVLTLKSPDREAYTAVISEYRDHLREANDELSTRTIQKRQDAYEKQQVSVKVNTEALYRSMPSPCHSPAGRR